MTFDIGLYNNLLDWFFNLKKVQFKKKSFDQYEQDSIYLHCLGFEAESLQTDISKPGQIKPKQFA